MITTRHLTKRFNGVPAVVLVLIDVAVLKVGAALFERETILTQWK